MVRDNVCYTTTDTHNSPRRALAIVERVMAYAPGPLKGDKDGCLGMVLHVVAIIALTTIWIGAKRQQLICHVEAVR